MKLYALPFFILLLSSNSWAISKLQDIKWKEVSGKDGITVYQPLNYQHDSGLVPIRFKTVINHNILRVLSVLSDDSRKQQWLPRLKQTKIIQDNSIKDRTVYYRYESPWPFNDRDFVVHNQAIFNEKELIVSVAIKSIEHPNISTSNQTVRGTTYDGYSIIKPLGANQTSLEMGFLNSFGGLVPKWIVNIVQKKWPYRFMKSLKGQLQKNDIKINPQFEKYRRFVPKN